MAVAQGVGGTPGRPARSASRDAASSPVNAIAKQSRRGWRIDKPGRSQHSGKIDGVVALMMSLDIREEAPAPVRVLGYI